MALQCSKYQKKSVFLHYIHKLLHLMLLRYGKLHPTIKEQITILDLYRNRVE